MLVAGNVKVLQRPQRNTKSSAASTAGTTASAVASTATAPAAALSNTLAAMSTMSSQSAQVATGPSASASASSGPLRTSESSDSNLGNSLLFKLFSRGPAEPSEAYGTNPTSTGFSFFPSFGMGPARTTSVAANTGSTGTHASDDSSRQFAALSTLNPSAPAFRPPVGGDDEVPNPVRRPSTSSSPNSSNSEHGRDADSLLNSLKRAGACLNGSWTGTSVDASGDVTTWQQCDLWFSLDGRPSSTSSEPADDGSALGVGHFGGKGVCAWHSEAVPFFVEGVVRWPNVTLVKHNVGVKFSGQEEFVACLEVHAERSCVVLVGAPAQSNTGSMRLLRMLSPAQLRSFYDINTVLSKEVGSSGPLERVPALSHLSAATTVSTVSPSLGSSASSLSPSFPHFGAPDLPTTDSLFLRDVNGRAGSGASVHDDISGSTLHMHSLLPAGILDSFDSIDNDPIRDFSKTTNGGSGSSSGSLNGPFSTKSNSFTNTAETNDPGPPLLSFLCGVFPNGKAQEYHVLFKRNNVSLAALSQMEEEDLRGLGVPIGPRIKILRAAQRNNAQD